MHDGSVSAKRDRRSEPRISSEGAGTLTLVDSPAREELIVDVLDVSRSGLQVEVAAPLKPGSRVSIRLKSVTVAGEVGNCKPNVSGRYRIGILTRRVE
jgi:hypothetical protein